mgnify:CR=1 FL=1
MKIYIALCFLLSPLLSYGQALNCLTIQSQPLNPACQAFVCGQVQDVNGHAISGAQVGWQTLNKRVHTDANGVFCLKKQNKTAVMAAWAEGYLIGGQTQNTHSNIIVLKALPTSKLTPKTYTWFDSVPLENKHYPQITPSSHEPCSACHPRLSKEWQQSAHGNSHNNETFNTLLAGIPVSRQEKCQQCHNPQVTLTSQPTKPQPIGCDYCHKIKSVDNGQAEIFGHARINHHIPKDGALAFAQLDDPVGRNDYYAPLYGKSEYCGGCHEASFWRTPIYSTFSEWQHSPQGKEQVQCQDCHMQTQATLSADPKHGGKQRDPQTLSSHDFSISKNRISKAIDFAVSQKILNQQLTLTITLNNLGAGHDIPTGNPMRHLLLRVMVLDEHGNKIKKRLGSQLPRWSQYAGETGAVMAKVLSPKQSYGNQQNQVYPAPFWLPSTIESDTRLKPNVAQHHRFTFASSRQYHVQVQLWNVNHFANWQNLPTPNNWLLHEWRDQIKVAP